MSGRDAGERDPRSAFTPESVGYPLASGEFAHIDGPTQEKLLRLMARASESSFRRGYHHGGLESRKADPEQLRFDVDLDESPRTDVAVGEKGWRCTSLKRLMVEHWGVLWELGFRPCGEEN